MRNFKFIVTPDDMAKVTLANIHDIAEKMLKGGPIEVVIKRLSRSLSQNAHFHALINEISEIEEFYDKPFEVVKALLVDWFAEEMEQQGTPLKNPPQSIWDWRRKTFVSIRPSTTDFRVFEAGCFIEFLYCFGTEHGVRWSSPALKIYESYMEAQK